MKEDRQIPQAGTMNSQDGRHPEQNPALFTMEAQNIQQVRVPTSVGIGQPNQHPATWQLVGPGVSGIESMQGISQGAGIRWMNVMSNTIGISQIQQAGTMIPEGGRLPEQNHPYASFTMDAQNIHQVGAPNSLGSGQPNSHPATWRLVTHEVSSGGAVQSVYRDETRGWEPAQMWEQPHFSRGNTPNFQQGSVARMNFSDFNIFQQNQMQYQYQNFASLPGTNGPVLLRQTPHAIIIQRRPQQVPSSSQSNVHHQYQQHQQRVQIQHLRMTQQCYAIPVQNISRQPIQPTMVPSQPVQFTAAQQSSGAPSTTQSARTPSTMQSAGAPSIMQSARTPSTMQTARTPTTIQSARVPSTMQITGAPSHMQSARVPSTMQITGAPSPMQSAGTSSTMQSARTPSTMQTARTPTTIQSARVPSTMQITGAPSPMQSARVTSTMQITGAPSPMQSAGTSSTMQTARTPTTMQSARTPYTMQSARVPSTMQITGAPSPMQITGAPSTKHKANIPSATQSVTAVPSSLTGNRPLLRPTKFHSFSGASQKQDQPHLTLRPPQFRRIVQSIPNNHVVHKAPFGQRIQSTTQQGVQCRPQFVGSRDMNMSVTTSPAGFPTSSVSGHTPRLVIIRSSTEPQAQHSIFGQLPGLNFSRTSDAQQQSDSPNLPKISDPKESSSEDSKRKKKYETTTSEVECNTIDNGRDNKTQPRKGTIYAKKRKLNKTEHENAELNDCNSLIISKMRKTKPQTNSKVEKDQHCQGSSQNESLGSVGKAEVNKAAGARNPSVQTTIPLTPVLRLIVAEIKQANRCSVFRKGVRVNLDTKCNRSTGVYVFDVFVIEKDNGGTDYPPVRMQITDDYPAEIPVFLDFKSIATSISNKKTRLRFEQAVKYFKQRLIQQPLQERQLRILNLVYLWSCALKDVTSKPPGLSNAKKKQTATNILDLDTLLL